MTPNQAKSVFNYREIIVTIISVILLLVTVQKSGLKWSHLQISMEQWGYFILSMLVLLLTIWVQSIRVKIPWRNWFQHNEVDTFNGLMIGNFYNCLLPGNLGEGMRAWHLSKKNKVSFIRALASLGVEKYIDALNFVLYTCILYTLFVGIRIDLVTMMMLSGVVILIFLFYILIITNRRVEKLFMGKIVVKLPTGKWLYKLHFHIKSFLLRLTKKQIVAYLLLGYIIFALNVAQYFLVMKVADIPPVLVNFKVAFLVAVAMVVVFIIPSAPGNVGVIHYGIYSLLITTAGAYGIPIEASLLQALALYTVYLHLSYFLPEVIVGGLVLIKEKKWLF